MGELHVSSLIPSLHCSSSQCLKTHEELTQFKKGIFMVLGTEPSTSQMGTQPAAKVPHNRLVCWGLLHQVSHQCFSSCLSKGLQPSSLCTKITARSCFSSDMIVSLSWKCLLASLLYLSYLLSLLSPQAHPLFHHTHLSGSYTHNSGRGGLSNKACQGSLCSDECKTFVEKHIKKVSVYTIKTVQKKVHAAEQHVVGSGAGHQEEQRLRGVKLPAPQDKYAKQI